MDVKKILIGIAIVIGVIFVWNAISGPSDFKINDYKGKIVDVKGNTLIMHSGLKVKMLGVKEEGTSIEVFIKNNYLNKRVFLVADSKGKTTYTKNDATVYAYVKLANAKKECLNRLVLMECGKDIYTEAHVKDSLDSFRALFSAEGPGADLHDLALYMKQRSFLIVNQAEGSIGTGFFINADGLAITNTHVLADEGGSVAVLYDANSPDDSNIYREKKRNIKNIKYTSPLEQGGMDITIFSVELENNETVPYFNLMKSHTQVGKECSTFGNPNGFTASFTKGHISAYRDTDPVTGRDVPMVQYEMSTNGGNSGGPVCNNQGWIIAVHELGVKDDGNGHATTGLNFGIDILAVRQVLDRLGLNYGGK